MKGTKNPAVDPTLPKVEVTLGGETYFLCFTYGALAQAEAQLRKEGLSVNLLHALDFSTLDMTKLMPLLYAAISLHHPTMTVKQCQSLIEMRNMSEIFMALIKAYEESLAEPEKESVPLDEEQE